MYLTILLNLSLTELEEKKKKAVELLKFIDKFWSEYLTSVEEIRDLIGVKVYLPEDPQLAFFLSIGKIFEENLFKIENEVNNFWNSF